ncbi:cell wall-binding repeat-containing protein [Herbiconiux solani]|uniref:cell wall-binding repeat-containing protein n=1 Tax=Herbiconiux solani TaxID=661329 RepID=UPI000826C8A4|nr:cell wall-binding repeat-containing protein [Herbiconiux solani]
MAVAVEQSSDRAYVSNTFDGTVSVIDLQSNTVATTIPHGPTSIGDGASAIAVDEPHRQVYVANYNSHTVSVIDTTTNAVIKVIPYDSTRGIGKGPTGIAVDSNLSRAYVANFIDGTVSVIDTSTNSVTAVIPHDSLSGIGNYPIDIAIDAGLHRAYVPNLNDHSVSVIDTTTNSVITVIPHDVATGIGLSPRGIAVDSIRHRAFIANERSGTVSVVDTVTNHVVGVIPNDRTNGIGDGPDGIAVDPDGRQVWVATEWQMTAIDAETLHVIRVIPKEGSYYGSGIQSIGVDSARRHALVVGLNSQTVALMDLDSTAPLVRVSGADRYESSARLSAAEFPAGAPVAYVASGENFPDALSGGAVAGSRGAPLLLVSKESIPAAVGAELTRLRPGRIVVLGGPASVSDGVVGALTAYAPATRVGGVDRYAVSAALSAQAFTPGPPAVYVASGENFPDALAGGAVAGLRGAPVLLVQRDAIPAAVQTELARLRPGKIVILGGVNTVSAGVEGVLGTVAPTTRVAGVDRYDGSAAVSASAFPTGSRTVFIASGNTFPDALSGGPAAASNNAPILLVMRDAIPASVATELSRLRPTRIVVLGGANSVSPAVFDQLGAFLL